MIANTFEWDKFEKDEEILLYMYLVHHPDYPSRMAKIFSAIKGVQQPFGSLNYQPHVSKFLTQMKSKGLLFDGIPNSRPGRKSTKIKETIVGDDTIIFDKHSPRVFTPNSILLERFGNRKGVSLHANTYGSFSCELISSLSVNETMTFEYFLKCYRKFSPATVFYHFRNLFSEMEQYFRLYAEHAIRLKNAEDPELPGLKKRMQLLEENSILKLKELPTRIDHLIKKEKYWKVKFSGKLGVLEGMFKHFDSCFTLIAEEEIENISTHLAVNKT